MVKMEWERETYPMIFQEQAQAGPVLNRDDAPNYSA
jgi:hypothetical protein